MTVYFAYGGDYSSRVFLAGVEAAASVLGWHVRTITFDQANPGTISAAVQTAIASGPEGVIMDGVDPPSIKPQIAEAESRGIQLVDLGAQNLSVPGMAYLNTTSVNAAMTGKVASLAILAAARQQGQTAHAAVVATGNPIIYNNAVRIGPALRQYCAACTVQVIDVPQEAYFTGQSAASVVSFIQSHPNINVIFELLGEFEGGLVPALRAAGFGGVKVVGYFPTPAQNLEVQKGEEFAWLQVPFQYDGWSAVDVVARHVTHANADAHNNLLEPIWVLTRQYLRFDPAQLPDFPTGYAGRYEALWHVG